MTCNNLCGAPGRAAATATAATVVVLFAPRRPPSRDYYRRREVGETSTHVLTVYFWLLNLS